MLTPSSLVIIPGWGGSHETWREFVELAKPHFQDVRVIDLPCFGGSSCPEEVWGVEQYADFVRNKIQETRYKNIVLLGHSFGGAIAAFLAANNPDSADKLVLVGAAIVRLRNVFKRVIGGTLAKVGKSLFRLPILRRFDTRAKKILYRALDSPETAEETGMQKDIHKKIVRQDLTHLLCKIQTPTLVVWGSKDKQTPLRYGRKIARLLPNARFVTIRNGKHGIHHGDSKIELLKYIIKFVRNEN